MNISLKNFSITISILILFTACYDFFTLNEYHMENEYIIGIIIFMIFNIVRHFSEKIKKMYWLVMLSYISILFMAMASFYFLLLFSFGFGYTGREAPWNHIFAVFSNIALLIVTIIEFGRIVNRT